MVGKTTTKVTDQASGDIPCPPEGSTTDQKPKASPLADLLVLLFLACLGYTAWTGVSLAYNVVRSTWHSSVAAWNSSRTESERMAKIKDANERTESERIAKIKAANDRAESERMAKIKANNELERENSRIKDTGNTSPSYLASAAQVDVRGLTYAKEWRTANRESRFTWARNAITIVSKGQLSKLESAAAIVSLERCVTTAVTGGHLDGMSVSDLGAACLVLLANNPD